MSTLSIILVNYNGEDLLSDCLISLQQQVDKKFETTVIDNLSTDGSIQMIKEKFSWVKLICNSVNAGFGRANNVAVSLAQCEYLLFLNTDTILTENTPQILLEYLQTHPNVGAIGPRIVFADGSYQLSAGKLPNLAIEFIDKIKYALDRQWHQIFANLYQYQYADITEVEYVTGACLMIRRDLFTQLGGFDENFFMHFEDKDLCKRVREAGFKVIYYPNTSLIHLLGGSSQATSHSVSRYYRDSQLYYYQKHLGKLQTEVLKLYLRLLGKV